MSDTQSYIILWQWNMALYFELETCVCVLDPVAIDHPWLAYYSVKFILRTSPLQWCCAQRDVTVFDTDIFYNPYSNPLKLLISPFQRQSGLDMLFLLPFLSHHMVQNECVYGYVNIIITILILFSSRFVRLFWLYIYWLLTCHVEGCRDDGSYPSILGCSPSQCSYTH